MEITALEVAGKDFIDDLLLRPMFDQLEKKLPVFDNKTISDTILKFSHEPPQMKQKQLWQFMGNPDSLPLAISTENGMEAWARIYPSSSNDMEKALFPVINYLRDIKDKRKETEFIDECCGGGEVVTAEGEIERELMDIKDNLLKLKLRDCRTKDIKCTLPRVQIGFEQRSAKLEWEGDTRSLRYRYVENLLSDMISDIIDKNINVEYEIKNKDSKKPCGTFRKKSDTADVKITKSKSLINANLTSKCLISQNCKDYLPKQQLKRKFTKSNSSLSVSCVPQQTKMKPKKPEYEYRVGSPDGAISRTGLFPVIPKVSSFRPIDPVKCFKMEKSSDSDKCYFNK